MINISIYLKFNPKCLEVELVKKLKHLIENQFSEIFLAVIVHGSVATDEIIPYSDFDGLLIVKKGFEKSEKLEDFVYLSRKLIVEFDALQHHDWFIIDEKDLKNYPQNYFPCDLFDYSSLIFPDKQLTIEISISKEINLEQAFFNLTTGLKNKINKSFNPRNDYQLKSYLSEIMLLPTFFLQAKYQKGFYKKDSFELIKKEIDASFLQIINLVSKKRLTWERVEISKIVYFLSTHHNRKIRKIAHKFLMPKQNLVSFKLNITDLNKKLLSLISNMELLTEKNK